MISNVITNHRFLHKTKSQSPKSLFWWKGKLYHKVVMAKFSQSLKDQTNSLLPMVIDAMFSFDYL